MAAGFPVARSTLLTISTTMGQSLVSKPSQVNAEDSAESLAAKVFDAECELYPQVINAIATGKVKVSGRRVDWV